MTTRTYEAIAYQQVEYLYTVTITGDYLTEDEWQARARLAALEAHQQGAATVTAGPVRFDDLRGRVEIRRRYTEAETPVAS